MLSSKYFKDNNGIYIKHDYESIKYSDGNEVEERILKQVSKSKDNSIASDYLQSIIEDWPSEYHFSPLRSNLLSPFNLKSFNSVLEIGSGCGAITRYLGENFSKVFALEGSYRRSLISKKRCSELKNVNIICENIKNFECDFKFDLITLIGVLEYSPIFFSNPNSVSILLNNVYNLLDDNGVLIVAIENQLGLKYFNGCSEDHTNKLFYGLSNLYSDNTAITFGREEIKNYLQTAGFKNIEFVYPFPDYKLPQTLVREEALDLEEINVGQILGNYKSRDYINQNNHFINEAQLWPILERNHLIRDLSNSFLIFAFRNERSISDISDDWLVKTFSSPRKKNFLTTNKFYLKKDNIFVDKNYLFESNLDEKIKFRKLNDHLYNKIEKNEYINGIMLQTDLFKGLANGNSYKNYKLYLDPWINYLKNKSFKDDVSNNLKVSGKLLDCLPFNLIKDKKGKIQPFDLEWICSNNISLNIVILRGIYNDFIRNEYWYRMYKVGVGNSLGFLIKRICYDFELSITENTFNNFIKFEAEFQSMIDCKKTSIKRRIKYMKKLINKKIKKEVSIQDKLQTKRLVIKRKLKSLVNKIYT